MNNPRLVVLSKNLRRRQTDAERKLWSLLRSRRLIGYKFRRQEVIGSHIVDFVCFKERLIIELDGGRHVNRKGYDDERTADLNKRGFRIVRFWDNQVLQDRESVLNAILSELHHLTPHPAAGRPLLRSRPLLGACQTGAPGAWPPLKEGRGIEKAL